MDHIDFNKLEKALNGELPGINAQLEMAPVERPHPSEAVLNDQTRHSGVLILLYPHKSTLHTVFILRPTYNGVHSGQVAFPGGKREEIDKNIEETALREAEEEVGVDRSIVQTIGKLTQLYIPPSNALVTPTIGFTEVRPNFIPDIKEVAAIIESPLHHFFTTENVKNMDVKIPNGVLKSVPYYDLHGHRIWGATAMMISEFVELLRRL